MEEEVAEFLQTVAVQEDCPKMNEEVEYAEQISTELGLCVRKHYEPT